ncbi:unnamed protein product [Vicia faba]|uniref:Transmembrane protein n=1 Tax=Vicia faba TaxID=3906 RepID=A0AAV1AZQ1_VICFA|nr:unnamed protein product [Vicia faba]
MHTHHSYSFFHYHYLHSRHSSFPSVVPNKHPFLTSYPYFQLLVFKSFGEPKKLTKISISFIEQVLYRKMNLLKEPTRMVMMIGLSLSNISLVCLKWTWLSLKYFLKLLVIESGNWWHGETEEKRTRERNITFGIRASVEVEHIGLVFL